MCFYKMKIYWNLEFYSFKVQLSPDCEFLLLEEEEKVLKSPKKCVLPVALVKL